VAPTTVPEQTRTPEAENEALSCLTEGYPCVSVFSLPVEEAPRKASSQTLFVKAVFARFPRERPEPASEEGDPLRDRGKGGRNWKEEMTP